MPLEMSVADLKRDLQNCVVMYKNKPVHVNAITQEGVVIFTDLLSNREDKAPFTVAAFCKPIPRVGFVNSRGSVVYLSRISVRQYYMGLCPHNMTVKAIDGVNYPAGKAETKARVGRMDCPELAQAILNVYPSFEEAVAQVGKERGACAFDKQFALSSDGTVFYKGTRVGSFKKTAKKSSEIVFEDEYKHLSILLENNYEKDSRAFRPAFA